jgi:hypothetical protein
MKAGNGTLTCQRELIFGRDGLLYYPSSAYQQIKNLFNTIHDHDEVSLSLKVTAAKAGQ